jgi:hypothetical protein
MNVKGKRVVFVLDPAKDFLFFESCREGLEAEGIVVGREVGWTGGMVNNLPDLVVMRGNVVDDLYGLRVLSENVRIPPVLYFAYLEVIKADIAEVTFVSPPDDLTAYPDVVLAHLKKVVSREVRGE